MTETQRGQPAVVVPAVGTPSSVAVLRSLAPRGIHTVAASARDHPPAFSSRHCDETVSVPDPTADLAAYADALLALARRDDVRTVVPMREADVRVLAARREAFGAHVATPWPTDEDLAVAQDRLKLFAAAERAGVPAPETALLSEVEDWDRELIVKSRYAILTAEEADGADTDGTRSPAKTVFLEAGERPDAADIRRRMHHDPIVQEFVGGPEYTYRGVFDNGDPVSTALKRLVRGYKYPRGPSIYHEAAEVPELEAHAQALLEELDWHGLASVGFRQDPATGAYKLMEINPRFWASLPMDVHAGVDQPYHYWRLAMGCPGTPAEAEYRPGTASHLLRGELVHLYSVLFETYPLADRPSPAGTLRNILASVVTQPHFDLLSATDPGPFVRDTLQALVDR